jgi:hypothetical protein
MIVEERVQDRLVEFFPIVRATVPAKPFRDDTVIVDTPVAPTLAGTLVGLAVIAKSCTVNVTVTECDSVPLVPLTVTWMVEANENVQDSDALPDPVRRVGDTAHDVLLEAKSIPPEKPFSPIVLIGEMPGDPASVGTLIGVAVIAKSWKTKVMSVEFVIDALVEFVAVTVAVTVSGSASLQESMDVPLVPRLTLVGFSKHVAVPVTVTERLMVPVSPFRDATVTVEVPGLLTVVVALAGFASRLMPGPVPP